METLDTYLDRLASTDPVPGGGSAATIVGAVAAALIGMVARICGRNPKEPDRQRRAVEIAGRADELRAELVEARLRDEAAFGMVVAAQALPKGDESERDTRRRALDAALDLAAQEPLHAAALALEVLQLAEGALEISSSGLASDVGCAAEFAYAALEGAAYNVRVNHRFMQAAAGIGARESRLTACESEAREALARVRAAVAAHLAPST
ncbi:MAG: cyclodeaminase/cyclohydrolase family protein [Candidatus Baltobacteraceae bacterium]